MTTRRRYEETAAALAPTWASRAPAVTPDFLTPALQALFLGALGGAVVGVVVNALTGLPIVGVGLGAGLVVTLGAFLWRLRACDRTLWTAERLTGRDIDGDGAVGQPAQPWREPVLVNPYTGQRARAEDEHAQERAQFAEFVTVASADSSARNLERRYGRARATSWRDALIGAGWAAWRTASTRDGWALTDDPAAIVAALG